MRKQHTELKHQRCKSKKPQIQKCNDHYISNRLFSQTIKYLYSKLTKCTKSPTLQYIYTYVHTRLVTSPHASLSPSNFKVLLIFLSPILFILYMYICLKFINNVLHAKHILFFPVVNNDMTNMSVLNMN